MTNPDQKMPPHWNGPPTHERSATGAPAGPPAALDHGGGGGSGYDAGMHERIAKLETTIGHLATKSDIDAMRTDFEKGQKENRAWMLATVLALFAGILGAGGLVLSTLKTGNSSPAPSAVSAPAAPQPIIIQIPPQTQAAVQASPPPAPAKP